MPCSQQPALRCGGEHCYLPFGKPVDKGVELCFRPKPCKLVTTPATLASHLGFPGHTCCTLSHSKPHARSLAKQELKLTCKFWLSVSPIFGGTHRSTSFRHSPARSRDPVHVPHGYAFDFCKRQQLINRKHLSRPPQNSASPCKPARGALAAVGDLSSHWYLRTPTHSQSTTPEVILG